MDYRQKSPNSQSTLILQKNPLMVEGFNMHQSNMATASATPYAAEDIPVRQPAIQAGDYSLRALRTEAEITAISRALKQTGWNRRSAAKLLRISYRGLLYKIRQHKITRDSATRPISSKPEML